MIDALRALDRRGLLAGLAAMLLVGAGTILGSGNLRHYDPILLTYTFGVLFSAFAVAYRTTVWLQRPSTRMYLKRGFSLVFRRRHLLSSAKGAVVDLAAQRFIARRGALRWFIHFNLAWGTMLAGAVTFPLVLGWLHFDTRFDDPSVYQVVIFGTATLEFRTESLVGFVMFNLLNLSAIMVTLGAILSLARRLRSEGAMARQQFGNDILPLLLLLAISLTGLMLTFSMHCLQGAAYGVLSLIHALVVSVALVYVPFGKFFHIVQRPLQIGVAAYRRENQAAPPARCRECGEGFAGALHVADLKAVMDEAGLAMREQLDLCPRCKRRRLASRQPGVAVFPVMDAVEEEVVR